MKKSRTAPKIDWIEGLVDLAITLVAIGLDALSVSFLDRRRSASPKRRR